MKMKKLVQWTLFTILLFMVCSMPTSKAGQKRVTFEPPEDKVLLIIGKDVNTIHAYFDETGVMPGGIMVYTSLQNLEGLRKPIDLGTGIMHADSLSEHYPNSVMQIGLYMVDTLKPVIDGELDRQIYEFIKWLKSSDVPVYLRIGYEFDGPHNRYDPELYKAAYVYIVDTFRKEGVDNVAFVWHSFASKANHPIEVWYPGDVFVDWVGLSYFNQPEEFMQPVIEFASLHDKPLMIAEASPLTIGTDWGMTAWKAWYRSFFRFIHEHEIQVVSYIYSPWRVPVMWKGQIWGDAQALVDEMVLKQWMDEINRPEYLHASPQLFEMLGYIASD